jgi:hypothetical protein
VRLVLSLLLLGLGALGASGCQSCVDDGTQTQQQQNPNTGVSPPRPGPIRVQPRLLAPGVAVLRDAGAQDE